MLIMIFSIKWETNIYLNLLNYSQYEKIDMKVEIDDQLIFNDTVHYHNFIPSKIKYPLRIGFHKIFISSDKAGIDREKYIFLFFNQYIIIQFKGIEDQIADKPSFGIDVLWNPYYFE